MGVSYRLRRNQLNGMFFLIWEKALVDINFLLRIRMHVNLSFRRLVESKLNETTCALHVVHNGSSKGMYRFNFDFDGLAHHFLFYFKHCPGKEDYKLMKTTE